MLVKTFLRKPAAQVAVIILWQVLMLACYHLVDASHDVFLSVVVIASWLVPFVGYMVAGYGTTLLVKWPRPLRAGSFMLSALIFTLLIYVVLGVGVEAIKALTRG